MDFCKNKLLLYSMLLVLLFAVGCSNKNPEEQTNYKTDINNELKIPYLKDTKKILEAGPLPTTVEWNNIEYSVTDKFTDSIDKELGKATTNIDQRTVYSIRDIPEDKAIALSTLNKGMYVVAVREKQ